MFEDAHNDENLMLAMQELNQFEMSKVWMQYLDLGETSHQYKQVIPFWKLGTSQMRKKVW